MEASHRRSHRMRTRYFSIACIGTMLALAGCAEPETPSADGNVNEPPEPGIVEPSFSAARGPLYLALDSDENGRISPEEARAVPQLAQNFERYDADGSGGIDQQEYQEALDEGLTPDNQN
jgi:hypothetical protein